MTSHGSAVLGLLGAAMLAGSAASALAETAATAGTEAATMCGRKADMVDIMIDMQRDSVESVWRDGKIFVSRDATDGSLWGFSLPHTTVHPAAFCRRTVGEGDAAKVETGLICAAGEKACTSFAEQIGKRMDKIEASATP